MKMEMAMISCGSSFKYQSLGIAIELAEEFTTGHSYMVSQQKPE
jgi:hypothetical protein